MIVGLGCTGGLAVLAGGVVLIRHEARDREVERVRAIALEASDEARYWEVIELLRVVIAARPDDLEAIRTLAEAYAHRVESSGKELPDARSGGGRHLAAEFRPGLSCLDDVVGYADTNVGFSVRRDLSTRGVDRAAGGAVAVMGHLASSGHERSS